MTLKLGVLGSTNGTDLPAVVESIQNGELKGLAEIAVVISDKEDAGILDKAQEYGLQNLYVSPRTEDGQKTAREIYDIDISRILDGEGVGLIVLIGYMRLFGERFVNEYRNKCMNIHPSLLPSPFTGMDLNVHKAVLDYGSKVSGCTLFFVDEGEDTGPIILQKPVPVLKNDTPETLKARVQSAEKEILPKGIRFYAEGRLHVEGRKVYIR